jgi:hypothetical protein
MFEIYINTLLNFLQIPVVRIPNSLKKYKTAPVQGREACKGQVQLHSFLISVPDGSGQDHITAAFPPEKNPVTIV